MAGKSFDPNHWTLNDVFSSLYSVPVYQRPYSWGKDQVISLLDDLFDSYFSREDDGDGLFTGTLFLHSTGIKIHGLIEQFEIIDGQQRIATFSLILLALYSMCAQKGISSNAEPFTILKKALWKPVNFVPQKEYPVITLNSLEKSIFKNIFDYAYGNPKKLDNYIYNYSKPTPVEKDVMDNYKLISDFLNKKFEENNWTNDDLIRFISFLFSATQFIEITVNVNIRRVFEMFESINSKGKKLEDIDLIKTFIFSQLEESDYDEYLEKWGNLIMRTNDNLYSYLKDYIKAFISFYRYDIKLDNFQFVARHLLASRFGVPTVRDALKRMIDDMVEKVPYFEMLSDTEKAGKVVNKKKFKFFFHLFSSAQYEHPSGLFLRLLHDVDNGLVSKEDATEIVFDVMKFELEFLTICGKDSKDAIDVFNKIMQHTYANGKVDKDFVENTVKEALADNGVTPEAVLAELEYKDLFSKTRVAGRALCILDESLEDNGRGGYKVSYDKAYSIFKMFEQCFSLDHLLVQTPDKDDPNYSYYKDETKSKKPVLRLKTTPAPDFPTDRIFDGMEYDSFLTKALHHLGNLRVQYKDLNSGRQNTAIDLKDYGLFTKYKQVDDRTFEMFDRLSKAGLL